MTPKEILDFWFAEECRPCWFQSTPEFDKSLQQRFESVWQSAREGGLNSWRQTPLGCLALVIVLDQFPLNMFRGEVESFSTEAQAREISRIAIDNGFDRDMNESQRLFLYLPYMHSEDLVDQDVSVSLFEAAGMESRWAKHHRDIVRRFGRFPHRNGILGRSSSEAELAYLDSEEAFKG